MIEQSVEENTNMMTSGEEHSSAWLELMTAYQEFRHAIFNWAHESDAVKYQDLFMELGAPVNSRERDLHRRLMVTNLLKNTDMWDEKVIMLVSRELTEIALCEHLEVSCNARTALKKIKSQSERRAIADQVLTVAETEWKQENPDADIFYNACMLLYDLECNDHFSELIQRYSDQIYASCGLDQNDLEDMRNVMEAKAALSP
ncbi:MAG: hypothetical protein NC331_12505 [Lachnospiraceae bacterium]|nr:hypothetical protein [Lachnospiraceae bacterium]